MTIGMDAPVSTAELRASVVVVLTEHARLAVPAASLAPTDDLYVAGMSSHASVNVMLALEDAFDLEFPERMLRKSTFSSVGDICRAVQELLDAAGAAG